MNIFEKLKKWYNTHKQEKEEKRIANIKAHKKTVMDVIYMRQFAGAMAHVLSEAIGNAVEVMSEDQKKIFRYSILGIDDSSTFEEFGKCVDDRSCELQAFADRLGLSFVNLYTGEIQNKEKEEIEQVKKDANAFADDVKLQIVYMSAQDIENAVEGVAKAFPNFNSEPKKVENHLSEDQADQFTQLLSFMKLVPVINNQLEDAEKKLSRVWKVHAMKDNLGIPYNVYWYEDTDGFSDKHWEEAIVCSSNNDYCDVERKGDVMRGLSEILAKNLPSTLKQISDHGVDGFGLRKALKERVPSRVG